MKSSSTSQQDLSNKRKELEEAEEKRRKILENQMRFEEQRLRLESKVKKLNQEAEAKQKADATKKKKDDLQSQRKDLKSEGQARTNMATTPTQSTKGSENKSSLSNITNKSQTPVNRQETGFSAEPFTFDPRSMDVQELIRSHRKEEGRRIEESIPSYEMLSERDNTPSQKNELLRQSNARLQEMRKEQKREEYDYQNETEDRQWELRKSQADKLKEEQLDSWRTELKEIKDSLKNINPEMMLGHQRENSNANLVKKPSFEREKLDVRQEPESLASISASYSRIKTDPPVQDFKQGVYLKGKKEEDERMRDELERAAATKERLNQISQSLQRRIDETPSRASLNQGQVEQTSIGQSGRKVNEDYQKFAKEVLGQKGKVFDDKTKFQLEVASKIKQLQIEKEKEKKKNEENALKMKQQILNQLKNKTSELGSPPASKEEQRFIYSEEQRGTSNAKASSRNDLDTREWEPSHRESAQKIREYQKNIEQQLQYSLRSELKGDQHFINREQEEEQLEEEEEIESQHDEEEPEEEYEEQGNHENRGEQEYQQYEEDEEEEQEDHHEEENHRDHIQYEDEEEEEEEQDFGEDNEEIVHVEPQNNSKAARYDENYNQGQRVQSRNNEDYYGSRREKWSEESDDQEPVNQKKEVVEEKPLSYAQLHARNRQSANQDVVGKSETDSRFRKTQEDDFVPRGNQGKEISQSLQRNMKDSNFNYHATFGRKDYGEEENDAEEEIGDEEYREGTNGSEENVNYGEERSDESEVYENSRNQQKQNKKEEFDYYEEYGGGNEVELARKSTSKFGGGAKELPSHSEFRSSTKMQHNDLPPKNFKPLQKSMNQKDTDWGVKKSLDKKPSKESDDEPHQDYKTANFGDNGYQETAQPARARKKWGEQANAEGKQESRRLEREDIQTTEHDVDEEDMLNSYKQKNVQKSKPVEEKVQKEVEAPKQNVVLVFDDDKDQDKVQKQRERMMRRFEKNNAQKRDKSRSFVSKEQEVNEAVVSDNEGHSDETPKQSYSKSKRIVSARPPSQKLPDIHQPKSSHSRNYSPNRFVQKQESWEEIKSVEPSAKSNKSMAKSPGGANNIFQNPKTKPLLPPQKKSTIEFSKQSNRAIIKNAITNVCLAGELNRKEREEILAKINEVKTDMNFIIVFKPISGRQDFKALYVFDNNTDEIRKLYSNGNAPLFLEANIVENYYRYNSGSKEFKPIQGNKNFSLAVDAVSLQPLVFKRIANDKLY